MKKIPEEIKIWATLAAVIWVQFLALLTFVHRQDIEAAQKELVEFKVSYINLGCDLGLPLSLFLTTSALSFSALPTLLVTNSLGWGKEVWTINYKITAKCGYISCILWSFSFLAIVASYGPLFLCFFMFVLVSVAIIILPINNSGEKAKSTAFFRFDRHGEGR